MKNRLPSRKPIQVKKRVLLFLLVGFLLPNLGFAGIRNSVAQQGTASHKALALGYKCVIFTPLKFPTFSGLNTFDVAQKASNLLKQHGYTKDLHENLTDPSLIRSSLMDAEVFFYTGHADIQELQLTNDQIDNGECKRIDSFTKDDLPDKKLDNLKLVLLSACKAGAGDDSILIAFKNAGAKKVIGFNRSVNQTSMNKWSEKFWKYALEDNMEVADAARTAADEVERTMFRKGNTPGWLTADALVIKGEEPVYLNFEESSPDFTEALKNILAPLWGIAQEKFQQLADQLNDGISSWWAKQWPKVEKAIEDWVKKELSSLLQNMAKKVEELLTQICLQPLTMVIMLAGVFIFRRRGDPL